MRIIVRSHSIRDCQKQVDIKKRDGWKPIMDIKLDDSHISWGDISYVCVMEQPDRPEDKETTKKRRFNRGPVGW